MKKTSFIKLSLFYFACFHLSLILLVVLGDSITGMQYLLASKTSIKIDSKDMVSRAKKCLRETLTLPGIYHYSLFSGCDAGYNYFAPKVARSVSLECVQYDSERMEISRLYYPLSLKTHEGIQRYSVSLSNFNNAAKKMNTAKKDNLYHMFTQAVGLKILQSSKTHKTAFVELNFSTYVYPSLSNFEKGIKPTMINIKKINLKTTLEK
ncbi:hypothetical protein FA048_01970 [Pedobacter polaris]|uniref:Uncharacterized protein n=1 Tax=Pedobacter polaris TaxID=2571273 RepID=A0A4U1CYJ1_9SPHI|nr:hypothetical protein [Pedobacter polaris]TKC12408.1 hypothetical protein FA048_01970 [Pedobacter polaris]